MAKKRKIKKVAPRYGKVVKGRPGKFTTQKRTKVNYNQKIHDFTRRPAPGPAYAPPAQSIAAPVARPSLTAPATAQGLPFDGSYEEKIAALARDRDLTDAELLHRANQLRYEYGFDDIPNPFKSATPTATQPPPLPLVQPTQFPSTPSMVGRADGVDGGVDAPVEGPYTPRTPIDYGVDGGVGDGFTRPPAATDPTPATTTPAAATPAPDPSNPFSRAAMLQRAYQQSMAATRGNRASQGQLYSGALQSDLDEGRFGYERNVDTERRSYAESLNALTQQQARAKLAYETGVTSANRQRIESVPRAT